MALSDGDERYEINPVGLGLALLGAVTMVIAVFLPRVESATFTFGGIQQNTLIQSGDGWLFIGIAAGIAGAAYRSWKQGKRSWAVIVLGLLAIGIAYYDGTDKDSLTLYHLDQNGDANILGGAVTADPGVGIYVAGVGGVLTLLGGWQMRRNSELVEANLPVDVGPRSAPTKTCPDCAETILAAAKVCRHCGYRFDSPRSSTV
jgi:hypothetical protein